jgi:L1 cell adhesion molecule like protein
MSPPPPQQWHGYKIAGDNVDKSVKPRHEAVDHRTQSLHYFHSYAVCDQIDFLRYSDDPTARDVSL